MASTISVDLWEQKLWKIAVLHLQTAAEHASSLHPKSNSQLSKHTAKSTQSPHFSPKNVGTFTEPGIQVSYFFHFISICEETGEI